MPKPSDTVASLRVIKKLNPGSRGAKALTLRYGPELVCVRHRIDATGTRKLTTVELLVDERPIAHRPGPVVDVAVRVQELDVRQKLKSAGARWDPQGKVWRIRRATAVALGLRDRIVKD